MLGFVLNIFSTNLIFKSVCVLSYSSLLFYECVISLTLRKLSILLGSLVFGFLVYSNGTLFLGGV